MSRSDREELHGDGRPLPVGDSLRWGPKPRSTVRDSAALAAVDPADYEWVCVDMFDTLVTRTVHPQDVKRLACERLARTTTPGLSGGDLFELRDEAEREVARGNADAGADPESTLEDCLELVSTRIRSLDAGAQGEFVRLGLEIELATECSVQRLDSQVAAFVRSTVAGGGRCALISDYYLGASELRAMLRFHGIDGSFESVFSSADDLFTKRSGRKYEVVLAALGCPPERVLMLGDDPLADVEQARAHGLAAIHLERDERSGPRPPQSRERAGRRNLERRVEDILSGGQGVFPELALTLYCLVDRLYDELLARGVRDVFFLSREGQPLRRLFDEHQSRRTPTPALHIQSHYLELSRRSTFLPSLGPLDEESFETLFRQYRRISWGEFLRNLGLEDLTEELRPALETEPETRVDDLPGSPELRALLRQPAFRETYETRRLASREALRAYLASFPVSDRDRPITLVDIGWKGTTQDHLSRLLTAAPVDGWSTIHGLYAGLVGPGDAGPSSSKRGVLFSLAGTPTPWWYVFNENRSLFETLLAADHGPVVSYRLQSDGVGVPVHGTYPEEALVRADIRPVQRELERRFSMLEELLATQAYTPAWLHRLSARHHARMVYGATPGEIDWFASLFHVENFGVFERTEFHHAPAASAWRRVRFSVSLLRPENRRQLGFWPWLACRQQGGRVTGGMYRLARQTKAAWSQRVATRGEA